MRLLLIQSAMLAALLTAGGDSLAQIPEGNPISGTIPQSVFTIEVEDVLTIPDSRQPGSNVNRAPRLEDLVVGGAPGLAYVIDQRGPIYTFDPTDANPSPELFFDIYSVVGNPNVSFQTGLRGLAFHPDFNTSGTDGFRKFYTAHSRNSFTPLVGAGTKIFFSPTNPNHDSVVGEWTVDAQGDVIGSSYRELIRIGQPEGDHNIGQITFNPSAQSGDDDYGNLYITLGDGGGPGNPNDLAQDISTTRGGSGGRGFPHGSLLRINPIAAGGAAFQIPNDNPFAGDADTIQEVYAYGLRNPHKATFDAVTGKLLVSDIGQSNVEEVNLIIPGGNYGWNEREGTFDVLSTDIVGDLPASHVTDDFVYPVAQYDHDLNNNNSPDGIVAIVGGPVYRGDDLPGLRGRYVFGDFAGLNKVFSVGVGDLELRDDFSNLDDLDGGFLAPIEEIRFTRNGSPTSLLALIRAGSGNFGLNRLDIRLAAGPDGEVYVLNKHDGTVRRFASITGGPLPGDYNEDGVVDAADYTVWRDNLGAKSGTLPNDPEGGPVGVAQYNAWRDNFGASAAGAAVIPEPGTLSLILLAPLALHRRRG